MLNCKEMTKLISDSLDRKITLRQRTELWLHIMMCRLCRQFRADAFAVRRKLRADVPQPTKPKMPLRESPADLSLSPSARARIASAMSKQHDEPLD
jgi:hypothetical protein